MAPATLILGIDAAWTPSQPSGVALVTSHGSGWRCLAVAPSYAAFDHLSRGTPVDWTARPHSSAPSSDALLTAVERLAGRPPDVIAIDMPLSHQPITKRRAADDVVSRRFGALQSILDALAQQLGPPSFTLPRPEDVRSLSALKRHEDALDALVRAYVGVLYATGQAEALGDASAAIWAPPGL